MSAAATLAGASPDAPTDWHAINWHAMRRIVRRLQAEYPDKIRATLRARNVGMHRNFIESYQACTGEYVAFLDADDYWTSPDKLQKQVDFLDSHPGCSMCFHNAHVRFEDRDAAGVVAAAKWLEKQGIHAANHREMHGAGV